MQVCHDKNSIKQVEEFSIGNWTLNQGGNYFSSTLGPQLCKVLKFGHFEK
jgi:hypothetical protein